MGPCDFNENNKYYNGYDPSICKIICNNRINFKIPWSREYATNFLQCPKTPAEKKALQYKYNLSVIKNKNRYSPNITQKQQYANLVNGKPNLLTRRSTYSAQSHHITNPNVKGLTISPTNPNILFACPPKEDNQEFKELTQFILVDGTHKNIDISGLMEYSSYSNDISNIDISSVIIGTKVNSIGAWALTYCSYLKSVKIPPTVTIIKDLAFSATPLLTTIRLPSRISLLGNNIFSVSGLKSVTYKNKDYTTYSQFYNMYKDTITIHPLAFINTPFRNDT